MDTILLWLTNFYGVWFHVIAYKLGYWLIHCHDKAKYSRLKMASLFLCIKSFLFPNKELQFFCFTLLTPLSKSQNPVEMNPKENLLLFYFRLIFSGRAFMTPGGIFCRCKPLNQVFMTVSVRDFLPFSNF